MALDYNMQEDLREFLREVYGPQVNGWSMDDKMFDLTYKLLEKSGRCTDLMHWVPHTANPFKNMLKELGKQAIQAFLQSLASNKEHYVICVKGAALGMKMDFVRASQGL